jgi:branched-chain amino acid transport system permease protein
MGRKNLGARLGQPMVYVPLILLILLGLSTIFIHHPFYLNILVLILFYAAASSAWNLVGGYAGQLSLGHAAFFGIGAYTSTLLYLKFSVSPWLGLLMGGGLAMLFAVGISYPCFRLRGPFFALATIAFAEVMRILSLHFREVTQGGVGLTIPFKPGLGNFIFGDKKTYAFIAYAFLLVMVGISFLLERSRAGYYLAALRDDEDVSEATGINTSRHKLGVMIISAFFTAAAGTFYAQYMAFIDPDIVFSLGFSIHLAMLSIIGGMGTIIGPILGSFILTPLDAFLRGWLGGLYAGLGFIVYGSILIIVVTYLPDGVIKWLRQNFFPLLEKLPRVQAHEEISIPPLPSEKLAPTPIPGKEVHPLFEVRNLSKSFGGLKAVHNVSFHIQQGEILGLIGPNGAGKTTIFNLISGFLEPDGGSIYFQGEGITHLRPPHRVALKGIGRTFQLVRPFSHMTGLENVMIGGFSSLQPVAAVREKALQTLEVVGLSRYQDSLATSLPIGDRKRLELARALATDSKLLLLDEVMGGLNPREVADMIQLLQTVTQRGVTLLIIEHVMKAIMALSHRIVVLHYGQIIAEGTPEEIRRNPKVIEAYLGEEYLYVARS